MGKTAKSTTILSYITALTDPDFTQLEENLDRRLLIVSQAAKTQPGLSTSEELGRYLDKKMDPQRQGQGDVKRPKVVWGQWPSEDRWLSEQQWTRLVHISRQIDQATAQYALVKAPDPRFITQIKHLIRLSTAISPTPLVLHDTITLGQRWLEVERRKEKLKTMGMKQRDYEENLSMAAAQVIMWTE